jgi:hypothetical protein
LFLNDLHLEPDYTNLVKKYNESKASKLTLVSNITAMSEAG